MPGWASACAGDPQPCPEQRLGAVTGDFSEVPFECEQAKFALLALLLAACQSLPTPTPAALSAASLTPRARPRIIATQTPRPIFASLTPSLTPNELPVPSVTLAASLVGAATRTPLPAEAVSPEPSHLLLDWPLLHGAEALSRVYPYGGTNGLRLQVHHGVDLIRAVGTPILAAADGIVVHGGSDFSTRFGAYTNYYGNRSSSGTHSLSDEQPSSRCTATWKRAGRCGQAVARANSWHGWRQRYRAGATSPFRGALGSAFDFDPRATRNCGCAPADHGLVAGRVTAADGRLLYGVTVDVQSAQVRSSAPPMASSVNADVVFGENFTLGNLPRTLIRLGAARHRAFRPLGLRFSRAMTGSIFS